MHFYNKYRPAQDTRPLTNTKVIKIYATTLIFILIAIIFTTGYILVEKEIEIRQKEIEIRQKSVNQTENNSKTEKLTALDFYDYFNRQEEIDKHQAYLDYIEQHSPPEEIEIDTTTQKTTTTTRKLEETFRQTPDKSEKLKRYAYSLLEVAGKTLRVIHYPLSIFSAKKISTEKKTRKP